MMLPASDTFKKDFDFSPQQYACCAPSQHWKLLPTIIMRLSFILALFSRAAAHGAGAWKDPHHYKSDASLAGTRYISEGPPPAGVDGLHDGPPRTRRARLVRDCTALLQEAAFDTRTLR